jgi:hypothetical protein
MKKSRNMTSAIEGMSIPTMRKLLNELRHNFSTQTPSHPFLMSQKMDNSNITHGEFSYELAIGLHVKRIYNRAKN